MIDSLPLTGKCLIEASAGTGKTYTLTSILLRLLLETDASPKQLIATTFTRKAAHEMRERLYVSIEEIKAHLTALLSEQNVLTDDAEFSHRMRKALEKQVTQPLYLALMGKHLRNLDDLIAFTRRVLTIENELDQIVIGTLDSLYQRWLNEFSPSIDGGEQRHITNDPQPFIATLLQQYLRNYYHHHDCSELPAPDLNTLTQTIEKQLSYGDIAVDAPIAPPDSPLDGTSSLAALLEISADAQAAYFSWLNSEDFRASISKRGKEKQYIIEHGWRDLSAIWQSLLADDGSQYQTLTDAPVFDEFMQDKSLNKGKIKEAFTQHPVTQAIKARWQFFQAQQAQQQAKQQYAKEALYYHAYAYVRQHLAPLLEKQQLTTFSTQSERLLTALKHDNAQLAAHIRYRYPIILVDESQDLNSTQAAILELIYLNPVNAPNDAHHHGYLLLVGDPKQAIYRFRGGDVANYNRLAQHFCATEKFSLTINYRSSAALIDGLNALYAQNPRISRAIDYETIQPATQQRKKCLITQQGNPLTSAIQWISASNQEEETQTIVKVVQQLLAENAPYKLEEAGTQRALQDQDILILARSNTRLLALQAALNQHHIATDYDTQPNLFSAMMAEMLGDLLAVLLKPNDIALQNRLCSTLLVNLSDTQLQNWHNDSKQADAFRQGLQRASQLLYRGNALSAIQYFLNMRINGQTAWEKLSLQPQPIAQRLLSDLRRLQHILSEQSEKLRPEQLYHFWQDALNNPPKADWAKSESLSQTKGVRLLTVHAAKGLQAPVVIVSNLTGASKTKPLFYHYSDADNTPHLTFNPETQAAQITQENEEEQRRLLYVALTRAEELLIVMHKPKDELLEQQFSITHFLTQLPPSHDFWQIDAPILTPPHTLHTAPHLHAPQSLPALPTQHHFYAWQYTSFSALARQFSASNAVDPHAADYAIEAHDETTTAPNVAIHANTQHNPPSTLNTALPHRFSRGTSAGSFLHLVLEKLSPNNPIHWQTLLTQYARDYQLLDENAPLSDYPEYQDWLLALLHSRLITGTTLAQLSPTQRCNELAFMLATDKHHALDMIKIRHLFAQYDIALPLQADARQYAYLRGEIDVVYEYEGKFHIIDYKSNYLGNQQEAYHHHSMKAAMDTHHYWLQSAIYQVALHRYLNYRLTDYAPERHLGSVEYYFLRGIDDGHFNATLPLDLILRLDQLLLAIVK